MSNLRSEGDPRPGREAAAREQLTTPPADPLMLSLDTATEVRSIAVTRGAHIVARTQGRRRREHAASVLAEIDAVLSEAGVKLCDIELFAVTTGPGSFTGVRAGIATIKAFAATLNRPVVGVPTLHAIASAGGAAPRVVAALPAGRGEVFAQLLSINAAGAVEELSEPSHASPTAVFEKAWNWGGNLKWAGAGASASATGLREFAESKGLGWREEGLEAEVATNVQEVSWTLARPVEFYAAHVAARGLISFRAGRTLVAEELQALYVRLSDAELNER